MAEEIDIKILIDTAEAANSVAGIKQSIKDLNNAALAVGEGGKGFDDLTKAAGNLKNKMGDLNAQTNALNGSGVEKLTAGMGLLKEAFTSANPQKVAAGFSVIGTAMKAIPIFLVIEGIKFLIENFEKLKNSGGLLGKVFTAIGDVISFVVDQLKQFADWIGITSFAADEAAEKTIAANNAIGASNQARYDDEIALATAAGEDTTAIEKKKQEDIIATSNLELEQIKIRAYAQGQLNDEQIKRVQELGKAIHDANLAIQVKELQVKKKGQDEINKLTDETNNKAKIDRDKRDQDARKEADKLFTEATTQQEKLFRLVVEYNRKRQIEDEQDRSKKLALIEKFIQEDIEAERQAAITLATLAYQADEKRVNAFNDLNVRLNTIKSVYDAKSKASDDTKTDEKRIWLTQQEELDKEHLDRQFRATIEANNNLVIASKLAGENALITEQSDWDYIEELRAEQRAITTQRQIDGLTLQYQHDIANAELTTQEKLNIDQKYANDKLAIQQASAEEEKKIREQNAQEALNTASSLTSSLSSLSGVLFDIKRSHLEKGSKAEIAAARKQFNTAKALGIAGAIIDGAKGVIASLAQSPLAIGPIPNPAGIASLAAVVLASVANIAKISSTKFDPGTTTGTSGAVAPSTGGGGGGGESAIGSFQPANLEKIGSKLTPTSVGGPKVMEPTKIYVVSSDITSSQNKNAVLERRASFN